jgi:hypothetical protein
MSFRTSPKWFGAWIVSRSCTGRTEPSLPRAGWYPEIGTSLERLTEDETGGYKG